MRDGPGEGFAEVGRLRKRGKLPERSRYKQKAGEESAREHGISMIGRYEAAFRSDFLWRIRQLAARSATRQQLHAVLALRLYRKAGRRSAVAAGTSAYATRFSGRR